MTQLIFHGGAREVGRSCIEIATGSRRLLLDCGLKLTEQDSEYPVGFSFVNDIDAVFISHAHLDHTGALPLLDHKGMKCPIFATRSTKSLTRILLRDAFKIGRITHQHLGYDELDIKDVLSCMSRVKIDTEGSLDGISYEYFDAGHIPGSASVFLDVDGTTFLYTGDINNSETRLQHAAETGFPEVDVLICESTYGDREHPERMKTEEEFLDSIEAALKSGGSVMIPVFAVGRSQEILMVLARRKFTVPVYLDGMSIDVTNLALDSPDEIKDAKSLSAALKKVKLVKGNPDRMAAIRRQSIIVTTSGMLTGGPIMHYMKYLINDAKNAILLTGYQAEYTNGRLLLDKGQVFIDGVKRNVRCKVRQFDFSAHAGMSQLKALVRAVRPKKVFFVHGDEPAVLKMHEWAEALGMESYAPRLGDIIDV